MKSKLLREEIKTWIAYLALSLWAMLATFYAFRNNTKTIIIGTDDAGTRIITEASDRLLQSELKNFIKEFLTNYYSYNDKTYMEHMGIATDLMSEDLYNQKKEEIFNLKTKLEKMPLAQHADIESIDVIGNNKLEAKLSLNIEARLDAKKVKLKVVLEYKKSERSETNPWGFTVTEVSDGLL